MRVAAGAVLREEQKRELERCARGRSVLRTRIVLLAAWSLRQPEKLQRDIFNEVK
jgi:hypothetical protein